MTVQAYGLTPYRIGKFKGEILEHASAQECLSKGGRQVRFAKNNSDTYVALRWLPYGGTAAEPNKFFPSTGTNVDRSAAIVQAHQTAEGITPPPESITPQSITVVMQQYSALYGWTDKTADFAEDDIPGGMKEQLGERITFINEMKIYGDLKACTNQYFGGTGTSRSTVDGGLSLQLVRKMVLSLQANHARQVNSLLQSGADYGTSGLPGGFDVYVSTDLEPDVRDIPNFIPRERYAAAGKGEPRENELGAIERFRFLTSPDFVPILGGGASVGSTGLASTGGAIDVYQFIVTAKDAWSQVAVRGKDAVDVTFLPTGMKSKADVFGQRGYAGAIWWKAVMIENAGWMQVGNVGRKAL